MLNLRMVLKKEKLLRMTQQPTILPTQIQLDRFTAKSTNKKGQLTFLRTNNNKPEKCRCKR